MTEEEIKKQIQEAADLAAIKVRTAYEKAKVESDQKYNELVAKWGRRAVNTVLIGGALAVAFFLGKIF